MKARGNVKIILQRVGEVQQLIGEAEANHHNDRDQLAHNRTTELLQRAQEICLEITGMYDPT